MRRSVIRISGCTVRCSVQLQRAYKKQLFFVHSLLLLSSRHFQINNSKCNQYIYLENQLEQNSSYARTMSDDGGDKVRHQMLKTSLVCAPSWTSGIGADQSDTDESNSSTRLDPSTASLDSLETNNCSSGSNSNHQQPTHSNSTATATTTAASPQRDCELLSIWVPTVYLTRKDPSSSSYHIYQIDIESSSGARWSIYRRYSQFHALHQKLRAEDSQIDRLFSLPPKHRINSKTSTIVQNRRVKLEMYMQSLCSYIEKSRPSVDRDLDVFYKFLSYSSKVSEDLEQLTTAPSSTETTTRPAGVTDIPPAR